MSVADLLDELVQANPGCRMAAYADVGVGLVFLARGQGIPSREALDTLCAKAALHLPPAEDGAGAATVIDASGLTVFLRSGEAPDEALCLRCDPEANLATLLPSGAGCLRRIAEEGAT